MQGIDKWHRQMASTYGIKVSTSLRGCASFVQGRRVDEHGQV
jgi:hypothetical protein